MPDPKSVALVRAMLEGRITVVRTQADEAKYREWVARIAKALA